MRRIDEIRERLDKATPGPWKATYEAADDWVSITGQGFYDGGHWMTCPEVATCEGIVGPDADLIANAPADLAWLLDALARRDQRCEDLAVSLDETRASLDAAIAAHDRELREQIAQKIEVEMRRHDNAQIGFSAVGDAYAHAARIARGEWWA